MRVGRPAVAPYGFRTDCAGVGGWPLTGCPSTRTQHRTEPMAFDADPPIADASEAPRPSAAEPADQAIDRVGIAFALAGSLLFSLKPIWIKFNYALALDAPTQLLLRMLIALPFYLAVGAFVVWRKRCAGTPLGLDRATVLAAFGVGLLGYYVSSMLDVTGLAYITANFERLILFTYPAFVALFGYWWFREQLTAAHLVSLVLSYCGLAIIFLIDLKGFGPAVATGAGLVLGCAVTFALYLLLAKPLINRIGSGLFTAVSMVAGTAGVAVHFFVTNRVADLDIPAAAWGYTAGMAVVSTVIPSLLVNEAIGRIGAARTSVTGSAGPVFTALFAIFLLGEPFTLAHGAGMALVIAGIALLGRPRTR